MILIFLIFPVKFSLRRYVFLLMIMLMTSTLLMQKCQCQH